MAKEVKTPFLHPQVTLPLRVCVIGMAVGIVNENYHTIVALVFFGFLNVVGW
jgi:hypothetical protein